MNLATIEHPVRVRLGSWPHDTTVAHIVLLDHHMVPDANDVATWIHAAKLRGVSTIRTGALFPDSAHAFENSGFRPIETLSLLETDLKPRSLINAAPHLPSSFWKKKYVRRLRVTDLHDAAELDGKAFDAPWSRVASPAPRAKKPMRWASPARPGFLRSFGGSAMTAPPIALGP